MTPEGLIKRGICEWLETQGCFFWIQQAGKIPGRIGRSRFQRNGVADILGVWKGRLLAIEVKTKTGKLSSEQVEFLDQVNRFGGIAFAARSIEDCQRELQNRTSTALNAAESDEVEFSIPSGAV